MTNARYQIVLPELSFLYIPDLVREHVYSRGKFVKKANHLANWVQVTSNSKKSDVAKFATCSEPI